MMGRAMTSDDPRYHSVFKGIETRRFTTECEIAGAIKGNRNVFGSERGSKHYPLIATHPFITSHLSGKERLPKF